MEAIKHRLHKEPLLHRVVDTQATPDINEMVDKDVEAESVPRTKKWSSRDSPADELKDRP